MSLRLLTAIVVGLVFANFTLAADPPRPQQDGTSELLDKLFNQQVPAIEGNINDMSLIDLLAFLSRKSGITLAINDESFKAESGMEVSEKKPSVRATNLRDLTLHQFLVRVLDSLGGTYIIKGNVVEIVPFAYAARMAKAETNEDVNGTSLKEPLVCAIIKQKPLTDAIDLLASRYDLSVTITPQARDGSGSAVSARLMNLPADKAIEMLAVQCDLRVVRRGNAFLITSREHAKTLLAEQVEVDRQKIELEKLRASIHRSTVSPQQKSELQNIPKPVPLPTEQTKP